MSLNRKLLAETLEKRQLLAANCLAVTDVDNQSVIVSSLLNESSSSLRHDAEAIGEGERSERPDFLSLLHDDLSHPFPHGPYLPVIGGSDFVQEHGDRLFVIDFAGFHRGRDRLVVFETADDGSRNELVNVSVEIRVERMFVVGEQVVLIGNDPFFGFNDRILPLNGAGSRAEGEEGRANRQERREDRPDVSVPRETKTVVLTINLNTDSDDNGERPADNEDPPDSEQPAADSSSDETGPEVIGPEIIRQEFDGYLIDAIEDNGRLILTTHGNFAVIAIYPPPPVEMNVYAFDVTSDGLKEVGSATPQLGQNVYASGTLLTGTTIYPHFLDDTNDEGESDNVEADGTDDDNILPPDVAERAVVTQYDIGDDSIDEVTSLDLGEGSLVDLHLSDDATTAIAVRSVYTGNRQEMYVDLLDLSQTEIRVFETVTIEDISGFALSIDTDHVLIANYMGGNSLVLIETNQSIDLAAENRIRRIEMPERLHLSSEGVRVSGGKLLFFGNRYPTNVNSEDGTETDPPPSEDSRLAFFPLRDHETVLVTVSLTEATLNVQTINESGSLESAANRLHVIDAETDRVGFITGHLGPADRWRSRFDFGHLNEEGVFVSDGTIEDAEHWREIDVDSHRLLARESDRVLEYRWDDVENPIIHPLEDDDRDPIVAVDDAFTLRRNDRDHFLNVLANDRIDYGDVHRFDENGNPDRENGSIENDDGIASSVRITELLDAPDGVSIAGHRIRVSGELLDRVDSFRFQYVISDGQSESTATVEVSVRDVEQRKLAELGLRILNSEGEPVEQLTAGDTFWIEFVAEDLRRAGTGVYAAFLSLEVPEELVQITGPIEYGEGFTSISVGSFNESQLIDLGAIGSETEFPIVDGPQSIFRIQATALAAGETVLEPVPSDEIGTETLLYGRDTIVPENRVRYRRTELVIAERPDPEPELDSNGDGSVTAADALKVINFLERNGTMLLEDLGGTENAEGETNNNDDEMASTRRNDTNRDGKITPLDALVVINTLQRQAITPNDAEPESVDSESTVPYAAPLYASIGVASLDDDEEET